MAQICLSNNASYLPHVTLKVSKKESRPMVAPFLKASRLNNDENEHFPAFWNAYCAETNASSIFGAHKVATFSV